MNGPLSLQIFSSSAIFCYISISCDNYNNDNNENNNNGDDDDSDNDKRICEIEISDLQVLKFIYRESYFPAVVKT